MSRAHVGLGSNLEEPGKQLARAFVELDELPGTHLLGRSSTWISEPLGPADQPDFLNAVACLETELEPLALLDELQAVERRHRRRRQRHWGPRTLDLDLLLYDDLVMDHPRLQLPHPGIAERDFVLRPLLEVAGDIVIPGRGRVTELLACSPTRTARRTDE